ncbi:MAG TPA: PDZ domain-containing protein, partial [Myxococcota bacterium]|nr:PDZ domain-containing protein [Myxococcota bacterium]
VREDGPAARAGIQQGDVITKIDGKPIEHWEDLPWYASIAGVARAVPLTVQRDGKTRELSVTMAPYPENASLEVPTPRTPRDAPEADLGLTVAPLPAARAKELGLGNGEGVVVRSVDKGSLGARLGVEVGDI